MRLVKRMILEEDEFRIMTRLLLIMGDLLEDPDAAVRDECGLAQVGIRPEDVADAQAFVDKIMAAWPDRDWTMAREEG